jgi:hypothetical protein
MLGLLVDFAGEALGDSLVELLFAGPIRPSDDEGHKWRANLD